MISLQEMAERRNRPNPVDRRLISERTAKSLRMQASAPRIYRQRQGRVGGPRFPYDNFATTVDEMEFTEEEDEPLGVWSLGGGDIEGARLNTSMYEAYAPTPLHVLDTMSRTAEPSPLSSSSTDGPEFIDRELVTSPRPHSPSIPVHLRTNFWSSAPSGTSLSRHHSFRRPIRSRTSDFSDFTSRRRSTTRQNSTQPADPLRPDDPAEYTWHFPSFSRQDESLPPPSSSASTASPRRYFPLGAYPHPRRLREDYWPVESEPNPPTPTDAPEPSPPASASPSSAQLWYSLTSGPIGPRRITSPSLSGERRQVVAPRLRRGGVRAPESLLSRYSSPRSVASSTISAPVAETTSMASTNGPESEAVARTPQQSRSSNSGVAAITTAELSSRRWEQREEETRQLLTPRSVSPAAGEN